MRKPATRPKARSFILQVSDFLPVRILDKQEAFRILKKTLNFRPDKIDLAKLKYDAFLDYYLPESSISNATADICGSTITTSRF